MRTWQFGFAILLGVVLLSASGRAMAQSDPELDALRRQVSQLHQAGRRQEAIAAAERYVEAARRKHGADHLETGKATSWLGGMLVESNRLAEAEPLMRRSLAIYERSFGAEHSEIAGSLKNLGKLLLDANRLPEAEPLFRRALDIEEKSLGPNHP